MDDEDQPIIAIPSKHLLKMAIYSPDLSVFSLRN